MEVSWLDGDFWTSKTIWFCGIRYYAPDAGKALTTVNSRHFGILLRFAAEREIDTSYAAWRLKTSIPFSICAVTRVRAARLSMED